MRAPTEPLAIVGIGCRFPGGITDLQSFWRIVVGGTDAISDIPADRADLAGWYDPRPATPGRIMSRRGGFLDRVDQFDAAFFEISPREATRLDPQQRLLLETTWEAIEDAGINALALEGSRTGVFVGQWASDYEAAMFGRPAELDFFSAQGSGRYAASGRISYALGLRGPALTVDTACSSSLVAVHLACRSLRDGECDLAVAAGVNVITQPHITIAYSQSRMMAPDGRCKFGDAKADGYVRAEGVGVILLKPLSRALADGDRVHAVIRGSAVNNDGRSSGLLGRPGRLGQEEAVRAAYADAGIAPALVGYVEAHGTGTRAGDPVELAALGAVLGEGRSPARPCLVGSVKTNFGHTEGAAGIAGLIKAALVLRHGVVPPSLHLETPNPAIPWTELPFRIPQHETLLASLDGEVRIAGVNSFGISGTNAHVVLEGPPPQPGRSRPAGPPRAGMLPLSARSPEALTELAGAYADLLDSPGSPELLDVCAAAALHRTPLEHRAVFVADTRAELADRLRRFQQGDLTAAQATGVASDVRPRRLAFVFPGQGAQWVGMARELLVREPAFRQSIERSEAALRSLVDWSLTEQLHATQLDDIAVIQPVLLAVEIGLADLWRAYGVEPSAVVGHSMGEAAAAFLAGSLSLEEAMAVVCRRSALMQRTSGQGAMAMVELSLEETTARLGAFNGRLAVAVNNGARSTVVAGEPEALHELIRSLDAEGVFCRLVKVDVASHSPQMDPLVPELVTSLAALRPARATMPLYSTVTAGRIEGEVLDPAYWGRNLRSTVRFREAIAAMRADGIEGFIEMSPHPVLVPALQPGMALASLRREEPEQATLLTSLGALFVAGHPVEWRRLYADDHAHVDLPHYPWQRERFWWEPSGGAGAPDAPGRLDRHPFLVRGFRQADGSGAQWNTDLVPSQFGWLADHRVGGAAVFPAAGFCEAALAAASEARPDGQWELHEVQFHAPLVLGEPAPRMQIGLDWRNGSHARFTIHGSTVSDGREGAWTLHASGKLVPASRAGTRAGSETVPPSGGARRLAADDLAAMLAGVSLEYGPAFRPLRCLVLNGRTGVGDVRADADGLDASASRYAAYPPLLDAGLQALVALLAANASTDGETILPASIGRLHALEPIPLDVPLVVRASLDEILDTAARGSFRLLTADGRLLAEAADVVLARVRPADSVPLAELLYDAPWSPTTLEPGAVPSRALLIATAADAAAPLAAALRALGTDTSVCVAAGADTVGRGVAEFLAGAADGDARSAIVHLLVLGAPPPDDGAGWSEVSWRLAGDSVLELVRAIDAVDPASRPRLWLVSRRAVAVSHADGNVALGQSLLWGLGRVMAHEYPALDATLVDLDTADVDTLLPALGSPPGERQLALRSGQWYALRLRPRAPVPLLEPAAGAAPYTASTWHPGVVEQLHWEQAGAEAPAPDEVEIEVAVTGLNFMNLLSALGMYPGFERGLGSLGIECAGRVRRVGDAVTGVVPGDAVVAVAPDCLGSRAVAHQALVAPLPAGLTLEDAAALPIVFLTAWYGLHHLARLSSGERVLIHSAAGGVGLAAIQVAHHLGAEVIATAGTAEKRELVRSLGAVAAFDSRSGAFADDVLEATGGLGVDVVLNSLAGDAIEEGLRTLAPYGRFVELGKRDIYGTTVIGLQPFRRNLSYFAVDLDRMMHERPVALGRHLKEVLQRFGDGTFTPLPVRRFGADELVEAFRALMPGTHVGKHVVSHASRPSSIVIPAGQRFPVATDGTYLITGGLGGLGLEVAAWLARRGAGCLVLLARGAPSPEAEAAIATLDRQGTRVVVERCDVAERAEVESLLARVRATCPPLRGVFHAAGILQDAPLVSQTPATLRATGRAKVLGAWHLDRLTQVDPLDAFVLFSSVASLFGTPGQANYAAANGFLDALAHDRRARGRPALSVNFGPVRDVGLAAASALRGSSLSRLGFDGLAPRRVVDALDDLLAAGATQAACMHLDPARWHAATGEAPGTSLLAELPDALRSAPHQAGTETTLAEQLRATPAGQPRRALVEGAVKDEVGAVLRMPAVRVPGDRPLKELGLDSLMALELRHRLERRTGLRLAPSLAWNYPTVRGLGDHLAERLEIPLDTEVAAESSGRDDAEVIALLAELEQLSGDEAQRLLAEGGRA